MGTETSIGDYRLILVTDLGIVVKKATDDSFDLFVQSIANGSPVQDATVEIIGKNGIPVLTTTTDASGRAHLPPVKGFYQRKVAGCVCHRKRRRPFIPPF